MDLCGERRVDTEDKSEFFFKLRFWATGAHQTKLMI